MGAPAEDLELRPRWRRVLDELRGPQAPQYWLVRFLLLRLLGLVYLAAFVSLRGQLLPLLGEGGLLPAAAFVDLVREQLGAGAWWRLPTLFLADASDPTLLLLADVGLVLALLASVGYASGLSWLLLWLIYGSFVRVGQLFYGYGWEIQLLETGFLAVFFQPFLAVSPFPRRPPPLALILLFRWLIVRIMLGAGLIKLRGDPCWWDLSCLYYHFETQPIPNPLSRWLHFAPRPLLALGVLFNHLVELVLPLLAFWPRRARLLAGVGFVLFQLVLITSGNLSFLNWLTIVPALACFDDAFLAPLFPAWLKARLLPGPVASGRTEGQERSPPPGVLESLSRWAVVALCLVVAPLSVDPVLNLLSGRQAMNASFDPLALVNTYGAFGSVGRARDEIILEGTLAAVPDEAAEWLAYELPCQPGDPRRRPCVTGPYQRRLDWQIWFAAMSEIDQEPWLIHLVYLLLLGDPAVKTLLGHDPFPQEPPRFIRATLWRYRFAPLDDRSGAYWERERLGEYLPPVHARDPRLMRALANQGWLPE